MDKLNVLDLFSGIGGFSLGLEATGGFETKAFCELDKYCKSVLKKHWPDTRQYDDIKELTYDKLRSDGIDKIDIITGGYPCQPFSVAGKQKGTEDKRHLWPEYFRLVKECRPTWVIGENVSGHIKLGLDQVIEDLESEGYATRTFSISASSIGANHQRERIWIIANTNNDGSHTEKRDETKQSSNRQKDGIPIGNGNSTNANSNGLLKNNSNIRPQSTESIGKNSGSICKDIPREQHMANSYSGSEETLNQERVLGEQNTEGETERYPDGSLQIHGQWNIEPNVGRVADGIPSRVDRLKSLGNSLVPQIPYYIGQTILRTMADTNEQRL
jgi:DNA (cytosine-5)-methyltransferase 1